MLLRLLLLLAVAVSLLALQTGPAGASAAGSCPAGFVQASLSWGDKCLHAVEFCKTSGAADYRRYGFRCQAARLSRAGAKPSGARRGSGGCEPGYSPCLPRVADLNCADIPAADRP